MIMDSSKAKKAKSKAKARTKQKVADDAQQAAQLGAMQQLTAQGLTPEIQAQQIAMQDKTQTVNPYHRMGQMPNNYYNPGNVVGGGFVPGS